MHVDPDLSAFLDGELAAADRARVEAHLAGCARCRSRLAELRATTALIAALPFARPSRSLVPVVTPRWNWLRPLRSASAVASGAFLFVFLVTAIGRSGGGFGGGDASTAAFVTSAGAPAAATAAATAASLPAPLAAPPAAAQAATAAPQFRAVEGASAAPTVAPDAARPAAQATSAERARAASPGGPLVDPLFWLGLAVIAATLAIAAHWRLRTP